MSDIAIRVENPSKQYRIGARQAVYRTLREALTDAAVAPFRRLRRNPKSEFRVHLGAERRLLRGPARRSGRHHRAQRGGEDDAYFDRLSTGLKVLSRITEPTEGYAEIHGRVGSLLEVGTGFHPELTGRDNIYLNGAIPSTCSGQAWG